MGRLELKKVGFSCSMASDQLIEEFKSIGLSEAKAKDTAKNANLSKNLDDAIKGAKQDVGEISSAQGMLLYHIASKIKPQIRDHLLFLSKYVAENKLNTEARVNAALEYLLQNAKDKSIDVKGLEEACGVGIVVTPEEIEKEVEAVISTAKEELIEKRYRFNVGQMMAGVRKKLPWADGKAIKNEFDVQILDLLGPKTDADRAPPPKKEKKSAKADSKAVQGKKDQNVKNNEAKKDEDMAGDGAATMFELMRNQPFHKPGENYKTDGYVIVEKTMENISKHLKRTGGQVRTRFPPEV